MRNGSVGDATCRASAELLLSLAPGNKIARSGGRANTADSLANCALLEPREEILDFFLSARAWLRVDVLLERTPIFPAGRTTCY